jgi:hypothetical protein
LRLERWKGVREVHVHFDQKICHRFHTFWLFRERGAQAKYAETHLDRPLAKLKADQAICVVEKEVVCILVAVENW